MIKENDRVYIEHLDMYGEVFYVDKNLLFVNHQYPIQLDLDNGGTYRVNLKEVKIC